MFSGMRTKSVRTFTNAFTRRATPTPARRPTTMASNRVPLMSWADSCTCSSFSRSQSPSVPKAFSHGEVVRGLILLCLDGVLSHSRPAPVAINSGPLYHSEPNNSRMPKEIVPIAHRSRNASSTHTLRDREYLSFIDCSNPPCGHRIPPLWPFLRKMDVRPPGRAP